MIRILVGHVLDVLAGLPAESVHCVVTSPPYYGLRDYGLEPQVWGGDACGHEWGGEGKSEQRLRNGIGSDTAKVAFAETLHPSTGAFCRLCGAWRGSLGLEPTLGLYLDHMVEVFRAVRRVLRKDGTVWLNVGSSYAGSWGAQGRNGQMSDRSVISARQIENHPDRKSQTGSVKAPGLKPKDLMLVPERLAIRLQDDGWYVRSNICWAKRAPMPESCTDRPTSAWEHVWLLSKSARYFYDAEAVKEEALPESADRYNYAFSGVPEGLHQPQGDAQERRHPKGMRRSNGKRNMRNFWLLGPEPFPEAHFATFPTEIPRRAILAGTSERGVCAKCGAPWTRVTKTEYSPHWKGGTVGNTQKTNDDRENMRWAGRADQRRMTKESATLGWRATCGCERWDAPGNELIGEPVPATILDPFLGSGTTALVADRLGRNCIGIELNDSYAAMARRRIESDAPLLAEVAD